MTEEEILQLAENHLIFEKHNDVWKTDTLQLLKFARELYASQNVTVLPGSYIGRMGNGVNPGQGRVRMALVAQTAECLEAAHRIANFIRAGRPA